MWSKKCPVRYLAKASTSAPWQTESGWQAQLPTSALTLYYIPVPRAQSRRRAVKANHDFQRSWARMRRGVWRWTDCEGFEFIVFLRERNTSEGMGCMVIIWGKGGEQKTGCLVASVRIESKSLLRRAAFIRLHSSFLLTIEVSENAALKELGSAPVKLRHLRQDKTAEAE